MRIIELTIDEFNNYASKHPLRNYAQSTKYAKVMGEKGYSYDLIGYTDDSNNLVAAALMLIKKIGAFTKYAYSPKGFLIDYYNTELFKMFVRDLSEYYKNKGISFIKINPEIIIGELNLKKDFTPMYNQNVSIIDTLKNAGFQRRREIEPLDFLVPRLNPYINLKTFDIKNISEEAQNNINRLSHAGLYLEEGINKEINILYDIIKPTTNEGINYYRNILNVFNEGDSELLLIKVNHEEALLNAQKQFEKEQVNNNYWNEMIKVDNNEKNLNEKMASDKKLIECRDDMIIATERLRKSKSQYLGGALVIKYQNRVSVIASGFNNVDEFKYGYCYLINALIERYKDYFDFLDLNGLAGNFDPESIYYEFNKEKLYFNPTIYEFIGEFDLILDENNFKKIQARTLMSKEFKSPFKFEQKK